jgi:hypothetical protein
VLLEKAFLLELIFNNRESLGRGVYGLCLRNLSQRRIIRRFYVERNEIGFCRKFFYFFRVGECAENLFVRFLPARGIRRRIKNRDAKAEGMRRFYYERR